MLEQLLIFTRGGLILWTYRELGNALKGSPIDALIRSCLLEERSGDASYNYSAPGAAYTLKWTFHNDLGLIFVAVFRQFLHLLYVDDLLAAVKREFSQIYDPKQVVYPDFDDTFRQLQIEAEARAEEMKKSKQQLKPAAASSLNKKQQGNGGSGNNKKKSGSSKGGKENGDGESGVAKIGLFENGTGRSFSGGNNAVPEVDNSSSDQMGPGSTAFDVNKLQKLRSKAGNKKTEAVAKKDSRPEPNKKLTKKNRVWDDSPTEEKLDFTDHVDEKGDEAVVSVIADQGKSMMDRDEAFSSESEDDDDNSDQIVGNAKPEGSNKKGWFSSIFQR